MSVIIQPAGSQGSRDHYRDTIENPVDLDAYRAMLLDEEYEVLRSIAGTPKIAMWGVTPGKSDSNVSKYNKLQQDDLVLFTRDKQVYASARIAYLFHNPTLARALWGEQEDGQTWEYMYALVDITPREIPYPRLRSAIGSKDGDNFMGFRVLDHVKSLGAFALLDETPNLPQFSMTPGEVIQRRELHNLYGGAWQGGIEPSGKSANIFLFTSVSGQSYGYNFDGLQENGEFFYTGDGQEGDQSLEVGGNKAILESASSQRALRLFRESGKGSVEYIGEFELAAPPYHSEVAPDKNGELRSVLVFHLKPVGAVSSNRLVDQVDFSVEEFVLGPSEQATKTSFTRNVKASSSVGERKEIKLQQAFEQWLIEGGHIPSGAKLRVRGAAVTLKPDLVVPDIKLVIEAKASSSRGYIREAIGQVLDYTSNIRRIWNDPEWGSAILVPEGPSKDLQELLDQLEITVFIPDERSGFVSIAAESNLNAK